MNRHALLFIIVMSVGSMVSSTADFSLPPREGLGRFGSEIATPPPDYNLILISIDTLRQDRLGSYGYPYATSPNMDRLTRDSIVVTDAVAQSPQTLLSHFSLLTSTYSDRYSAENPDTRFLAEILKDEGYKTAAFVDGGYLAQEYGLSRGFEEYYPRHSVRRRGDSSAGKNVLGVRGIVPHLLPWLKKNREEKFFLFIHTYDVHDPYFQPRPYREMFRDREFQSWIEHPLERKFYSLPALAHRQEWDHRDRLFLDGLYDSGIRLVDKYLGRLFQRLEAWNLTDRTLLVVTSDHGESLAETVSPIFSSRPDRRAFGHALLLETNLRVPLFLRIPDRKAGIIQAPTMLLDIVPTALDFLGLEPKHDAAGKSLLPSLEENELDPLHRLLISEMVPLGGTGQLSQCRMTVSARSRWKYLHDFGCISHGVPWGELYDLLNDPTESQPVLEVNGLLAHAIQRALHPDSRQEIGAVSAIRDVKMDPATREELVALGYIQ